MMFNERIDHLSRTPVSSHTWYVKKIFKQCPFDCIQMKDECKAVLYLIHKQNIKIK